MDLDSVLWLEEFLKKQSLPMVIVSHDREFLDQVCNKIVEVEDGVTVSYTGNYSKYLEQRRARLDLWREKYEKQSRFVQDEERWIKSAKSDPSMSSAAKARETALEKMRKSQEWIQPPPKDKKFRFRFPSVPRCGALVVEARNLSHGFGEGKYKTLFEGVNFEVARGDRIGFVGPNGSGKSTRRCCVFATFLKSNGHRMWINIVFLAGKSTMLKIIMGIEHPKAGYAEYGSSAVIANYYAQNQADSLDLNSTVLECLAQAAPEDMSFTDLRALLGQFMFKGDDVNKLIRSLSGGEKARVALCRMMLTPANLLLLDEVREFFL